MIKVERLAQRMREKGLSQSELARRVGLSQQAIGKLVSGASRSSPHIGNIATALETSPAYLVGQTDDPEEGATLLPTPDVIADQLDLVAIDEVDLAFGMGGTFTDVPVETRSLHFPRSFIDSITRSPPEQLVIARGRGDSMMPTLLDGDLVIIDRSQRAIHEQDAIWAIAMGEIGMIKRLRARPNGSFTILSDNPGVPADQAAEGELFILGRIVFIGRRI